jgi:hypothetical protein
MQTSSGEYQRAGVCFRIHSPFRQAQGPEHVEGLALAATGQAVRPKSRSLWCSLRLFTRRLAIRPKVISVFRIS